MKRASDKQGYLILLSCFFLFKKLKNLPSANVRHHPAGYYENLPTGFIVGLQYSQL
jgi:tetrahydromethanopterin S-methyltransferase subunit B